MLFFATNANASIRKLYSQNYEAETDASTWTSPNAANGLTLETDDEHGKYIQFSPGQTGGSRSASTTFWNAANDFYGDVTNYTLQFDASITVGSDINNNRHAELSIMTDGGKLKNNDDYADNNSNANYLFDLASTSTSGEFSINKGTGFLYPVSEWLHYSIVVDVEARTAITTITKTDGSVVSTDTLNLPEGTSTKATGIFYLSNRSFGVLKIDNILITTMTDVDVANAPTVQLTGVDGSSRTYAIAYGEYETLHYALPGTDTTTVEGGETVVATTSTSGNLVAWTTSGTATSDTVTVVVDAVPVSVAAPVATLSDIGTGYRRAYIVTEDNSSVLLNPQAMLVCQFADADGTVLSADTIASGDTIRATVAGTFTITASAKGYDPQTIEIADTVSYDYKASYPFKQMTREQLVDNDWLDIGESMTESRWQLTNALNFIVSPDVPEATTKAFPGLTLFTNKVPTIVVGYGLMAPLYDVDGVTASTYGTPLAFTNGAADEYAVINIVENYGSKSSTVVIPCNETYSLFRFSSMITDIRVYAPHKEAVSGINQIRPNAAVADDAYYTLGGVRVSKPTAKGIYIHNGKKIVL